MRYFVDAEFNGFGGALIALAAVPEDPDAAAFYEAVDCPAPTEWVARHVLPVLHAKPRTRVEVVRRFAAFLSEDPAPVLVADWPEDIAHAAALLTDGRGGRYLAREVGFTLLGACGFASAQLSRVPHNAYHDAVALRDWVLARERA